MTAKESSIGQNSGPEGLMILPGAFGPKESMDRLEVEARALGMRVFARIDHAEMAAEVGMQLRPTELLIFCNPRAGTPLMQANQTMGIELPLKVLVWQDVSGQTWLTCNDDLAWLAHRHGVGVETERTVGMMAVALGDIAKKVMQRPL